MMEMMENLQVRNQKPRSIPGIVKNKKLDSFFLICCIVLIVGSVHS